MGVCGWVWVGGLWMGGGGVVNHFTVLSFSWLIDTMHYKNAVSLTFGKI